MVVLVTFRKEEDPIKNEGARVVTRLLYYNPMGLSVAIGAIDF